MVTESDIRERADEVLEIVKWWSSRYRGRYSAVVKRGSAQEFAVDVWLRMIRSIQFRGYVDCTLSTMVVWACKWELQRYEKVTAIPLIQPEYAGGFRSREYRNLIASDECAAVTHAEVLELWARIKYTLSPRQYSMVFWWSGISGKELTHDEIGSIWKVTKSRVGQIIHVALCRLVKKGVLQTEHQVSAKAVLTKRWKSDAAKVLLSELTR